MPPEGAVAEQVPGAAPVAGAANTDWRTFINDELKADPVVTEWVSKASEKDIPSLIKTTAHAHKRMGSAINLPGKDAKPEEVAALRTKLYEAGVFAAPPADPKGYGLIKPEHLPEGLQWSDELSAKFATALHKHGVPKAALDDLLPLYMEAIGGSVKGLQVDREQSLVALKAEHGEKYEERVEMVKRMMPAILQTPDELAWAEETGLADHPKFLSMMLRLAPLAMQDSSFIDSLPHAGGEITGAEAQAELTKIMNDKTHPLYDDFKMGGKKSNDHINDIYRRAYGSGKVPLGKGVTI
jgi:hypothetical protein